MDDNDVHGRDQDQVQDQKQGHGWNMLKYAGIGWNQADIKWSQIDTNTLISIWAMQNLQYCFANLCE